MSFWGISGHMYSIGVDKDHLGDSGFDDFGQRFDSYWSGNRPKMDEIGKFLRIMFIHVKWHQKKGFSLGFEDKPYLPLPL